MISATRNENEVSEADCTRCSDDIAQSLAMRHTDMYKINEQQVSWSGLSYAYLDLRQYPSGGLAVHSFVTKLRLHLMCLRLLFSSYDFMFSMCDKLGLYGLVARSFAPSE